MSASKLVLLGLVGGAAALLFMHQAKANPPGTGGSVPVGWNPPPSARVLDFPAQGPGTIGLRAAGWPAEPGQPQGNFLLIWDPSDPASFVATFTPAGGVPTPMAVGTTPHSQLILSTIPNLIAKMQGG